MATGSKSIISAFRSIPSIDEILRTEAGRRLCESFGRERSTDIVRGLIESVRGKGIDEAATRESILDEMATKINVEIEKTTQRQLRRVINATGVIIHTNLGRAPFSADAINDAVNAAGYCNLEFDLETGERGRRGGSAEQLLAEMTGAEDALIVNNCAAAAFFVLSVFGRGGEVVVSRGELVEIGGDFRIPDVLERSGSYLREVGTTNRTKLSDYQSALNENTRLILRVHPSNYRITGFTETPPIGELADLARRNNLIFFEDAGSGALVDLSRFGLDEPVIADSIKAGVDLICFSGDKLMGGSQAGLIVGQRELIEVLRKDSLFRALRPDKMTYAIIAATLRAYISETAFSQVPALRYLSRTPAEINERAKSFIERLGETIRANIPVTVVPGNSAVGGGAAPGVALPTSLIAIQHSTISADDISRRFRQHVTPIVGRVSEDRFLIDLRTVETEDESAIEAAISGLA